MTNSADWRAEYHCRDEQYTLHMVHRDTGVTIVRHESSFPTPEQIVSLCRDEFGDVDRHVFVYWSLRNDSEDELEGGCAMIPPAGGVV